MSWLSARFWCDLRRERTMFSGLAAMLQMPIRTSYLFKGSLIPELLICSSSRLGSANRQTPRQVLTFTSLMVVSASPTTLAPFIDR